MMGASHREEAQREDCSTAKAVLCSGQETSRSRRGVRKERGQETGGG